MLCFWQERLACFTSSVIGLVCAVSRKKSEAFEAKNLIGSELQGWHSWSLRCGVISSDVMYLISKSPHFLRFASLWFGARELVFQFVLRFSSAPKPGQIGDKPRKQPSPNE